MVKLTLLTTAYDVTFGPSLVPTMLPYTHLFIYKAAGKKMGLINSPFFYFYTVFVVFLLTLLTLKLILNCF